MQINQFHSGTAVGDAITNQMLLIKNLLEDMGYESHIFAEFIHNDLQDKILNIDNYIDNKDNILIIHHSMGMNAFDKITSFKDKKILIYHNITPEQYFNDEGIKKYIRIGLKQLRDYRKYIDYAIADTNYNRKDMINVGYNSEIDVMPVTISLNRFDNVEINDELVKKYSSSNNILFVGRIVSNKKQTDLLYTFAQYKKNYCENSKLIVVGAGVGKCADEFNSTAKKLGLTDSVVVTGKVDEVDLKTYYYIADIFLSMSEHEGFGVPLLEAMTFDIPVVAYKSSAIPETLNGAGVLFTEKRHDYIAALIDEILTNNSLRKSIIQGQRERLNRIDNDSTRTILEKAIESVKTGNRKRTVQMQGPFETSYSLAIVNRNLIEAIDDLNEVDASIWCTEGPGDYIPCEEDLIDKKHAKDLRLKGLNVRYPDITIRNMYPPRVRDVNGGLNFQSFAWEETYIPQEYIDNFNKYLDGIGTTSDFVTETLIENGIKIPVRTIGNGVIFEKNFNTTKPYELKTKKKIKFLHISSAFPRKGVDVLLKAYFESFTDKDDVCLVLKTFPNPHNNVKRILDDLNKFHNNPPEIEWINEDLPQSKIYSLYKSTDCYVHSARGEGFGLPVAEAMLAKLPVIVCANSGMADFCNEDTALLVDYEEAEALTHINNEGKNVSLWFEPKISSLSQRMKEFYDGEDLAKREERIKKAYNTISTRYAWKEVAKRWLEFIKDVESKTFKPKVSMVTSRNNKCGIAEYSRLQVENSIKHVDYFIYPSKVEQLLRKDECFVQERLWKNNSDTDLSELLNKLQKDSSDIVHFQFNFGFYDIKELGRLISELSKTKKVIITFHATKDIVREKVLTLSIIPEELNKCYALIVHQEEDKRILTSFGIKEEKISIIPLGQIEYIDLPAKIQRKRLGIESNFVIGSYGFLLPHKGFKEVIEAVSELKKTIPDIMYLAICSLYDDPISKQYYDECKETISNLELEENVRLVTDFLPNEESMNYLHACDMFVMPYKETGESASGAIRFCLAAQRPIIATKRNIFKEFIDCSYQIEDTDPELIKEAILEIKNSDAKKYVDACKEYIKRRSWVRVCAELYDLYTKE